MSNWPIIETDHELCQVELNIIFEALCPDNVRFDIYYKLRRFDNYEFKQEKYQRSVLMPPSNFWIVVFLKCIRGKDTVETMIKRFFDEEIQVDINDRRIFHIIRYRIK